MTNPFPGPIPAESNPPIAPWNYEPSRFVVSNISVGITTLVTTSVPHNYVIGQQVRLLIPQGFGVQELNNRDGYVIAIPAVNQVIVGIVSVGFSAYISADRPNLPQIIAIGDINSGALNANGPNTSTIIQGSFINIS